MKSPHFTRSNTYLVVFVITIMLTIAAGWLLTNFLSRVAEKEFKLDSGLRASRTAALLQHKLEDVTSAAKALGPAEEMVAALASGSSADLERANRLLDRIKDNVEMTVCYLIDRNGLTVASTDRHEKNSFVGQSFASRPYFTGAIEGRLTTYFALGKVSRERGYYGAVPVIGNRGTITGVVVIKRNVAPVEEFFEKDPHVYLVSPEGIIFISSRKEYLYRSLWPVTEKQRGELLASGQFGSLTFAPLLDTEPRTGTYVRFLNENHYVQRLPFGSEGWTLVMIEPPHIVASYRLFGMILTVVFSLLLLLFFLVLQFKNKSLEIARELLKSRNDWKRTFDTVPDLIAIIDSNHRIINMNSAMAVRLGISQEEAVGRRCYELLHGSQEPPSSCPHQRMLESGKTESGCHFEKNLNGNFSVTAAPILAEDGTIKSSVHVMHDITALKMVELELREAHQHSLDIIQFYPDATMVIDNGGKVVAWNRAMEELSGVRAEEMLGRGDYEYALPFYGERRPILIDLAMLPAEELGKYEHLEQRDHAIIGEAYVHNARGEKLYVHGTAAPLHNSKGEVIGAIESIRDFTERKQMEDRAAYLASFPQLNPNPVLEVDSSGKVTFFNPAAQRILETLGIGRENLTVFIPADLHEILRDLNKKIVSTFCREIRVKERVFSEDIYIAPQFFDGARLFVHDITEQKRNEEAVGFKNIILATQQECTIDGILMVDDNDAIISYNRRFVEMWGIPPELPTFGDDVPLLQFVASKPMDPEGFLARVSYLYEHREEKSREEIALKDGRVFDRYSAPMTGSDGKYYGRVWYFSDITERKQMEEKLRKARDVAEESAERLEFVLEGSNDATWEWDVITNQGILNTRYYEMTEYTPGEIGITLEFFLSTIHPEDLFEVQRSLQETLEGKTAEYEAHYRMVTKSGKVKNVMGRGKVVRYDENGRPNLMAGVVTDITEMKRLSDEVNKIHNLESIGLLAGGMAHDFNNVLSVIYGNISFARMLAGGNSAIVEPLTDAEVGCERARELGIRLQAFALGNSPDKEPISLPAIIEPVARTLFKGSNILPTIAVADDSLLVEADPRQLRQVFENLLINAKEAMDGGGTVTVNIDSYLVDRKNILPIGSGNYIRIEIKDSGKGIPKENLPKIFDPYFSTKDTYSQKGLGLGLSICHAILKRHNGHISVDSTVGIGTRVTLYLPALVAETRQALLSVPNGTSSGS